MCQRHIRLTITFYDGTLQLREILTDMVVGGVAFDPNYVTPLNVAVKDTDETVVDAILQHDFSDPTDKKWLVRWYVIHHLNHGNDTIILKTVRHFINTANRTDWINSFQSQT